MQRRRAKLVMAPIALSLLACTLTASPASAVVQKTGSKSCGLNQFVSIKATGSGNIKFYYPSSTYRTSRNHGTAIYSSTVATGRNSTTWKVTTDGLLDDAATNAVCAPAPVPPAAK